jgi:riboflavin transporter FmnP
MIMALLMDISSMISMANMVILVALLLVYARIYTKTRATFTIGLALFAGMLMLHNGIAVYGYFAMAPLYSDELLPYFAGIHIAELIGLIALLKVTVWPEGLKTTKAAS